MTVETVKSKLKSVRNMKVRLMALQHCKNELAEGMDGICAVDYSKERVKLCGGNSVEERYIRRMDRLIDLQHEYDAMFDELCAVENELSERMTRLNPTEYQVIYERYMKGVRIVTLNSIARKFGYSIDGIKTMQKRAFKKMADI